MQHLLQPCSRARRQGIGGDAIALLALVGPLAVAEYLAAVISVMVASGRALEGWAAGRARRDLSALLQRAPRSAHRYRGDSLETVELDVVEPDDRQQPGRPSCLLMMATRSATSAFVAIDLSHCH